MKDVLSWERLDFYEIQERTVQLPGPVRLGFKGGPSTHTIHQLDYEIDEATQWEEIRGKRLYGYLVQTRCVIVS